MIKNHRIPDLTTEVEMVMGRSSGNIEADRAYFVEITDARSGFVIGKLRMGPEQYAKLLTGGTVDGVEGRLAPLRSYQAIGRWSWHVSLAFGMDFDGQGPEGNEERLEAALSRLFEGHMQLHAISAYRRRDGLTATLRGTSPAESVTVQDAQAAAAMIQLAMNSTGWAQRGEAHPYPTKADLEARLER